MNKFTYSFSKERPDETEHYYDTAHDAWCAAREFWFDRCHENLEPGRHETDVYISEIEIVNGDENKVLNTKHDEVVCHIARARA